ncbi:MAG: allantoinase AllB [Candidatus Marinimicrobia bacterium]|nr:allantoinase AllB [Candidatus Neomarinimicrobiota bacterium]
MIIKNGYIALPDQPEFLPLDIEIRQGKIHSVGKDLPGDDLLDTAGLQIFPGAIDPHVHFNDPGFTEREDFYHGSCAAASGGVTTIIDMPCTSIPPVTSYKNLMDKLKIVSTKSVIDFGFYGGISKQIYAENYPKTIAELADHVMGFKCYLISGMNSFQDLTVAELTKVMTEVKKYNRPVLLHAEDKKTVGEMTKIQQTAGTDWIHYYRSRPEEAEIIAVSDAIQAARRTECSLHIVHIGTGAAALLLKNLANITGETCPHYLEFNYNDFDRLGGALKTAPVVKSAKDSKELWECLQNGTLDFMASDHAPAPSSQKDTGSAWMDYSGIPGTGTLFPYLYFKALIQRRMSLPRFLGMTSENAARRFGIFDRKGSIEIGKDADFILVDPKQNWRVKGKDFLSKGKITPFENMTFTGKIIKTIVRGEVVYDNQMGIIAEPGYGEFLRPGGIK